MGERDRWEADDEHTLRRLGYAPELRRVLGAFSNFALSLSIICILAGGVTSFHLGLCGAGGAGVALGWPLVCLFSVAVALAMGQVASAFPTAGGLYHWSAILGGRGWGWATAWFNLAGLVTLLAAVNVGTYEFVTAALGRRLGYNPDALGGWKVPAQTLAVLALTGTQALINHRGIRLTARLTDFSGYWILLVAVALTASLLAFAPSWDLTRLVRLDDFGGLPEGDEPVWPTNHALPLFLLGLLLPAYTLTGFDASAHAAEETVSAARSVPRAMVRAVVVSGAFGWVMVCAVVLAAPDLGEAARQGSGAFAWIVDQTLPRWLAVPLYLAIALAQYVCGLAALTAASRMAWAFARDGGLPFSAALRHINPTFRTPVAAIWSVAALAVGFTVYTPVYSTIAVVTSLFLYLSYVLPAALGLWAYGRTWTVMGPWDLGRWYRPLVLACVVGCAGLFVIGVQPPNGQALYILPGSAAVLAAAWIGLERRRFPGPPAACRADPRDNEPGA
jgi:amino acid transporter